MPLTPAQLSKMRRRHEALLGPKAAIDYDKPTINGVFTAIEAQYEALSAGQKTATEELGRGDRSAARVVLRKLRRALRALGPEHAQTLADEGLRDDLKPMRDALAARITAQEATVASETPLDFAGWWARHRTKMRPAIQTARGVTLTAAKAKRFARAWLEGRF